jgi:hypothetical protein
MEPQTPSLQPLRPKPVKIWIVLLAFPFVLLVFVSVLQLANQITMNNDTTVTATQQADNADQLQIAPTNASTKKTKSVLNIASEVTGILSVSMIVVGTPIWTILLVSAIGHNKRISAQPPLNHQ